MKRTIAKILAAAMIFTSLNSIDTLAATKTFTITNAGYLSRDSYVSVFGKNSSKAVNAGAAKGNYDEKYNYFLNEEVLSALEKGDGEAAEKYGTLEDVEVKAKCSIAKGLINKSKEPNELDAKANAATSVEAKSKTFTSENINLIMAILDSSNYYDTTVTAAGEYKDVVVNADSTKNLVEWRVVWNGGLGRWQGAPRFDANNDLVKEIIRQLRAGNIINIPMTVTIEWQGRIFKTNLTYRRWFLTVNGRTDDEYWNAIIKLEADNNRYTPIRVHVDVTDGYLGGLENGVFVQVINGTVTSADGRIVTNALLEKATLARNLMLQDIQPDDLAMLKSDYAKDKKLLLDNAFKFKVNGTSNNNSLNGAGAQIYDFKELGQNSDIGTASFGKIVDVESRLFKDCREREIQAKNIRYIRSGAFRQNKHLKKAVLSDGNSIARIDEKSFYDCKSLKNIEVKVSGLKKVGKSAFNGSTDKKSLQFKLKGVSKKKKFKAKAKLFRKSGVKKAKFKKG